MPKIRRWFNVSHDINSDPEVWELTDQFGDRGLRAWLECLSIADRNEGFIPGELSQIERALSIKLNTFQSRTKLILSWFLDRTWLELSCNLDGTKSERDSVLRVRNYLIYKPSREAKKEQEVPPPRLPSETPSQNHPKKDDSKIPLKRQTKSPYPEDFKISDQLREWCVKQRAAEPDRELDAFRDFHIARGSRFHDWDAAFRTWIRNSFKFNKGGPAAQAEGELSPRTLQILRRGL